MGATFRNASGKRKTWINPKEYIFGINYAVRTEKMAPREANFNRPSENNIQMTIASYEGEDVLFQFRLTRDNNLQILAYDPNAHISGRVIINSENPSIDAIIYNKLATQGIKNDAQNVKDIIDKTYSGIRRSSLLRLIDYLKRRKRL